MPKRQYVVTISAEEAARLRAFDNATDAPTPWPLGPNRSFRRRGKAMFLVKEMMTLGVGKAAVVTQGKATIREGDRVDVTVRTRTHWLGWLLIASGVTCVATTPRDGFWALALGAALVAAGWFGYVRRTGMETDLDGIEKVLRSHIHGDWKPVDRGSRATAQRPGT